MTLTLHIEDEAILRKIEQYAESPDDYEAIALAAMRIGLEAVPVVRGAIDQQALQQTAEGVLQDVRTSISLLVEEQNDALAAALEDQRKSFDEVIEAQSEGVGELLKQHRATLLSEFSLDVPDSAIVRLQNEITKSYEALKEQLARQSERKSTRRGSSHGGADFEQSLGITLGDITNIAGDQCEHHGNHYGYDNNKIGDYVITLGETSAFAGLCISVEAKRDKSYRLSDVLAECQQARRNRQAEVGIFVWDRSYARAKNHEAPLMKRGKDIVVLWDMDDSDTDLYLQAAYWLARTLISAEAEPVSDNGRQAEIAIIQTTFEGLEEQLTTLATIKTKCESIAKEGENVASLARDMHTRLESQINSLREAVQRIL